MPTRVTIDENRITHVNGKPFFLIGARHMPEGGTPEMLRDAGFNGFRCLAFGSEGADAEDIPDNIEGIYFWLYIYDRADPTKSPDYTEQLREMVGKVKEHPRLLCYENYNEPTLLYKGNDFKAQPENLARGTAALRALDPDHPIWLAHCCTNTVATLQRFNPCADIIGANPYPLYVPGMRRHIGVRSDGRILDCPDQSIHAVGKYTEKIMKVADNKLAVWMLLQAMANESWYNPKHNPEHAGQKIDKSKVLYPTYDQMRFMAFDAVVHGATGLALSMHKTPTEGDVWEDVKRLAGELRDLHDALCGTPVPDAIEISYTDLGFTIWDGVRILVKRLGSATYIFAVNSQFDPAEVTFHVPGLRGAKSASVVHENREKAIAKGSISDRFEPYGTHVYQVETA